MTQVAVIGLGDMGSGLAKNLLAAGFTVKGFDLSSDRMAAFTDMGGTAANSPAEAGSGSDAVFVMVMNGDQVFDVVNGKEGLLTTLQSGSTIILTATIHAREARELGQLLQGTGVDLIDSPVSGGFPGAQGGSLTMMLAAPEVLLEKCRPILEAVSGTIHHVGTEPGAGQTVKACLQSIMGPIFSAVFEATVLAAKNGVDAEAFHRVVSTSSAGCGAANGVLENIINRKFHGRQNQTSGWRQPDRDPSDGRDFRRRLE